MADEGVVSITKPRMLQLCAVDFTVQTLLMPLIHACQDEYDVEICCASGPESQRLESLGYRFRYVPFTRGLNPMAHLRTLSHLVRLFRSEQYDIVHTHTPIAAALARIACRICNVPTVVNTVHGFYFHEHQSVLVQRVIQSIERFVGKLTDFTFFQSSEDFQSALELGICESNNCCLIGNGVDQRRFNARRTDLTIAGAQIRAELGASQNDVLIGIVARLVREKGIGELLEAFALVQASHPSARLVLVGDVLQSERDGVGDQIRAALSHPEYGTRIHWVGFRKDIDVILKAIDIFVLPSYREGLPRSIIEAMSMGLPVVATDIRGCREEVLPSVTGLLVPPRQITPLAKALALLVSDQGLRQQFGQAGRERALDLYNEDKVLRTELEVFRQLIGTKSSASQSA